MRIQFQFPTTVGDTASLDTTNQRVSRGTNRAPWQSAATNRTVHPMAHKGVGKRLSNAPRRRAY